MPGPPASSRELAAVALLSVLRPASSAAPRLSVAPVWDAAPLAGWRHAASLDTPRCAAICAAIHSANNAATCGTMLLPSAFSRSRRTLENAAWSCRLSRVPSATVYGKARKAFSHWSMNCWLDSCPCDVVGVASVTRKKDTMARAESLLPPASLRPLMMALRAERPSWNTRGCSIDDVRRLFGIPVFRCSASVSCGYHNSRTPFR